MEGLWTVKIKKKKTIDGQKKKVDNRHIFESSF